ncbi:MAG: glycoside hydrolase family 3 C-terminal domain-containing protein [Oscillospiraceae bacterium]|nr:glycoside hydrolase family 3 C-terminal domain-containing protein [Oscillospiraceae bacterium]MBR2890710.1 glycoside hydrolase family 3 C-terminal domain-containing protein [Oscillospiraceae bacterium]
MNSEKINELVSQMTITEKLGQLTQLAPFFLGMDPTMDLTGPMNEMNLKPEWIKEVGSTLNGFGARELKALQDRHMANSRLGIPLLFMADIVHGYKTGFPIPLAMGSSFEPALYERACEISAKEGAASGIHLTFAPMTDLVRDPRWGRVMESTGEDAYLNSVMTQAAVRGYQGQNPRDKGRLASCVKHFAAYGAPWGGRDYNTVDQSEGMLREYYLPAYKAAVDAGVAMVMTSFNTVKRVPASANKWLMRDVLREEWGFEGPVISDYAAVDETITHGIAADSAEAARKCLEAGTDIEMMSSHYLVNGEALVSEGKLDIAIIDEAVRRVLELKNALGLFENPYKDADEAWEAELLNHPEHKRAAYEIAIECPVLLKNEGVLPLNNLKPEDKLKIGVAGPFTGTDRVMGSWAVNRESGDRSLIQALRNQMPQAEFITAMTGELGPLQADITDVPDEIDAAVERLRDCDVIIAAVGENSEDTGESASKTILRLSGNQERMIHALHGLGKPVVAVLFCGRPMEIGPILADCDAVLQGWFLGDASGAALADLLIGKANPSGRLTMSIPVSVGQIPVHYNAFRTGRPYRGLHERYVSRYLDCDNEPLFPFGYGLSYSEFAYSDFMVEKTGNSDGVLAKARISVTNISNVPGKETVQLYIHDVAAQVVRPVKELKGFRKLELQPGETAVVSFEITKEMLSYWNEEREFCFEPGAFDIMLGRSSADVESTRIWIG